MEGEKVDGERKEGNEEVEGDEVKQILANNSGKDNEPVRSTHHTTTRAKRN